MKHLKEEIEKAIDQKLIIVRKHPTADLSIYNYSQKVQYDKLWDEVTMQCRGLILDNDYNVVARPMKKFFNYGEIQSDIIPNEPFEVTKKEDGSLGILYWIEDVPYIATRGSFESDQAIKGTDILHTKYSHVIPHLKRNRTYLFEIIFPSNRIVIDYGNMEDLILIAIIDNETGKDLPLEDIGFTLVKRYNGITDIGVLKAMEMENEEGFVVRFVNSNYRIKIKFSEYVRLHKILTQTSNIGIWEMLKAGQPLDEMLERVPDEFFDYVKGVKLELETEYANIEKSAMESFDKISKEAIFHNRKEFALAVIKDYKNISSVIFNMLDGKEYSQVIWKMLRPTYEKPFKTEAE